MILLVAIVVTGVATLLVADVDWVWNLGTVLRAVATGILVVVSGISINFLPKVVLGIWRQSDVTRIGLLDLAHRLAVALGRPMKLVGVVLVVAAIVGTGLVLRPPPTELEPGRLVMMTAFGESANDPRSILLDQWNQLHPENPVELNYAAGETDQQNARMVNDAKPGGAHLADIYALDLVWMAQFVDNGYIRPLDRSELSDQDMGDFVPKVLATCMRHQELWALPLNTDAGLLFHRSDIPGLAVPESWDDYYGTAAKAAMTTARSAAPGVVAANAAQLADEEVLTVAALEAIWAAGGEVVSANGQVQLNQNGSAVFFDRPDMRGIANLAAASKDADIVLTEDNEARETTETGAVEAFADGRTLFMRNWPVARDTVTVRAERVEFDVAVPSDPVVLGGQNLAISSSTDKPRAAQALIEFLTNPSSQLMLSEIGGFAPTRESAFSNAKRPYTQEELRTAVDRARLRPVTPHYTEFSQAFRKGIARALNNGGKLESDFAEELAEILRE